MMTRLCLGRAKGKEQEIMPVESVSFLSFFFHSFSQIPTSDTVRLGCVALSFLTVRESENVVYILPHILTSQE